MSNASENTKTDGKGDASPSKSPKSPRLLIPSPITTRRTRTYSATERAAQGPSFHGYMKDFCREKGHGFVVPEAGGEPLFCHISDIEGEYVPKPGDKVSYKQCHIPPKMEKIQAVHVRIEQLVPGVAHERWDAPFKRQTSPSKS